MIPQLSRLSFRVRLLIALACAVAPFATVLLFASLWVYRPMQDDIQLLSDQIQERFEEVSSLQLLLARSAMPPNDFLIHGRPDERIRFELMSGRIDALFKSLRRDTQASRSAEAARLADMQQRWNSVRGMGMVLLGWPKESRLHEGAEAMERFDREVDQLVEDAESLVAHVRVELEDARDRAIRRRHDLNRFVALSTAVTGILTMIMITTLVRTLMGPLGVPRAAPPALPQRPAGEPADATSGGDPAEAGAPGDLRPGPDEADSAVDPVTRLWSRRSLHLQLETETERALVLETPSSIAIVEIDGLTNADQGGTPRDRDQLLVAVAERIRHVVRQTDFPARTGPAEFAILMPATDLMRASEIAERIREHIAGEPVRTGGRAVTLTVSIGVAGDPSARGGHAGASTLLGRADQALHRARRSGGNRVERSGADRT